MGKFDVPLRRADIIRFPDRPDFTSTDLPRTVIAAEVPTDCRSLDWSSSPALQETTTAPPGLRAKRSLACGNREAAMAEDAIARMKPTVTARAIPRKNTLLNAPN